MLHLLHCATCHIYCHGLPSPQHTNQIAESSLMCSEGSRRFDNQVSLVTGQLMSEVYDAGVLADVQQAQRIVASCLTATTFRGLLDNVSHALSSAYVADFMNPAVDPDTVSCRFLCHQCYLLSAVSKSRILHRPDLLLLF